MVDINPFVLVLVAIPVVAVIALLVYYRSRHRNITYTRTILGDLRKQSKESRDTLQVPQNFQEISHKEVSKGIAEGSDIAEESIKRRGHTSQEGSNGFANDPKKELLKQLVEQLEQDRVLRWVFVVFLLFIFSSQLYYMHDIFKLVGVGEYVFTESQFQIFFVSVFGEIIILMSFVIKYAFSSDTRIDLKDFLDDK